MTFKTYILLVLLAGSTLPVSAQSGPARWDSLYMRILRNAEMDNQLALCYADSALRLSYELGDSLRIVKSHRIEGQILRRLDKSDKSRANFERAIPIAKRNGFIREYGYALNSLALVFMYQADYDKALKTHLECLVVREQSGDCEELTTTLNNLGLVYYKLGNYEKALMYLQMTLRLDDEVLIKDLLLINIGLCHNYLNDFETGKKFIDDGLKISRLNGNNYAIEVGEFGLGVSYFNLGNLVEAEKHFLLSYNLALKIKEKRDQIENLIYLGRIKKCQSLHKDALKLLMSAESIGSETEYKELLINIYKQFSELFVELKDFERASYYQSKFIALQDAVHSQDMTRNLMQVHAEFEEKDNKARISYQEEILTLKEEIIQRQKVVTILMGATAALVIGLSIVLYRSNRQKQQINNLLDIKVRERTLALEQSLNTLTSGQEEQRDLLKRTSTDLTSSIASIQGLCELANVDPEIPEYYKLYLKQFDAISNRLMALVRRLSG